MYRSLQKNTEYIKNEFSNSADLTIRDMNFPNREKTGFTVFTLEGMVSGGDVAAMVLNPIFNYTDRKDYSSLKGEALFRFVFDSVLSGSETKVEDSFDKAIEKLMAGFAVIFIDGAENAVSVGVQGFKARGVEEPNSEASQRGSREGFIEPIKQNMGLLRRRIPSTDLVFENMRVGVDVETPVCLCYRKSKVSQEILCMLRKRLQECSLKSLLASGYLVTYLEDGGSKSFFSGVGVTERPDTAAGKLSEGRIAIIVDGSPTVLIVPRLFIENFQSFDDYTNRPYYAGFVRILKYTAFLLSVFLPAVYVAVVSYYPQLIPRELLGNVISSTEKTPFPTMVEVLLMYFIYEITREAGLRIPKPLSQTIGIVGGLVIGESAVNAGIIGSPTLMVVAISAVCTFAVPDLSSPATMLRLVFILLAGVLGIWGIGLGVFVITLAVCSKTSFNIPYVSPIAPFSAKGMQDVFVRANWKTLWHRPAKVQDLSEEKYE